MERAADGGKWGEQAVLSSKKEVGGGEEKVGGMEEGREGTFEEKWGGSEPLGTGGGEKKDVRLARPPPPSTCKPSCDMVAWRPRQMGCGDKILWA